MQFFFSVGLLVALISTFVLYVLAEKQIDRAHETRYISQQLAEELRQSSDDLTNMVRSYVVTGNPNYERNYYEILDIRDGKLPRPEHYENIYWDLVLSNGHRPYPASNRQFALLDMMKQTGFTDAEFAKLAEAKANSDSLTQIEFAAMALVKSVGSDAEKNRDKARLMVFDQNYMLAKAAIMNPISDFHKMLDQRTKNTVLLAEQRAFFLRILVGALAALLVFMLWRNYRQLGKTLGGSVYDVYSHLERIGKGDFSTSISIPPEHKSSILGFLAETQAKLEELKNHNQALLERTQQIIDTSLDAIIVMDSSGIINTWNPQAEIIFGWSAAEAIGHKLSDIIIPAEDQTNHEEGLRRYLASGQGNMVGQRLEVKAVRRNGSEFPIELAIDGFTINGERQFSAFLRDITERKQAEAAVICLNNKLEEKVQAQSAELIATNLELLNKVEELRRSKQRLVEREAKLNAIFNASVEGIITYDKTGIIVSANAAVETIFGHKPEELIGSKINRLIPFSSREMNYCSLPHAVESIGQILEIEGIHKNGSVVPLDLSVAEFAIDNEHYFTAIVRDVSLRKHREQQDKEHLDELAHVTRLGLMGEMASGIAHEVNQPLSAISSYTQVSLNLINSEDPDLAKLTGILYKTQQQALRAGRIIHRMREFVKTHAKHRSNADINALIHNAADLCLAELKQHGIRLIFELEPNLPPVYVDQIQIEQVIINLLRNSIDALKSLPTKQQRQISIQSQMTLNDCIQVRVKDNGPGIDKDQQQKILTPFYTTKADGMGMGLSICRSLIEAHDGTFHFNSQPGKGTTFYFALPIAH
ncbi:MAG: PAS domain-containing sensor histidine kinase [Methylobacter sp.]